MPTEPVNEQMLIDENAELRARLADAEETLRAIRRSEVVPALFESAPDAMVIANQQGAIVLVNAQTEQLFGYTREELLGQRLEVLLPKRFRAHHDGHHNPFFAAARAGPMATGLDLLGQHKDGSEFPVEISRGSTDIGEDTLVSISIRDVTARRQAEQALRESQHFFRRISETTPGVLYVFDVEERRSVFINRTVASMLGYSATDVQAMGADVVPTLMHPDDLPRFEEHLRRARTLADGAIADFEHRMRDSGGDWRWFHSQDAVFARNAAGGVQQIVGTAVEITTRKESEAAVERARVSLQAVLKTAPAGILLADVQGNITLANDAMHGILGGPVTGDAHGPRGGYRLCRLDGSELAPADLPLPRALQAGATSCDVEILIRRDDGTEVVALAAATPLRGENGTILGATAVLQDITARKRTEAAIRESEAVLRTVTREAHVGLAMVNQERRYVFANETYATILGVPEARIMGQHVSHVLAHVYDEIRPGLDRALAGDRVQYELRLPVHPGTCDERVYDVVYEPRTGGARPYVVVVIVDITGRKNAQQILERTVAERTGELQRALDELETEIAERQRLEGEILEISEREQWRLGRDLHDDIGQQLVAIGMFAFKLETRLREEAHACVADVERLRTELGTALHTTRDLSKSLFPVELERGGLVLAIEELAVRTQSLTQVNCRVSADADFWIQRESAIHLYRLVQESITNAIKHGKPKNISIECRVRDGLRTVRICDDGVGFRMPDLASKSAGVGLQLFQYRARLLGARVEVRTMSDGAGCEVTCRFSSAPQTP
jgi:PAS domain S-box-containing protein